MEHSEPAPTTNADEGDEAPTPKASSKTFPRQQQKTSVEKSEDPSAEASPQQARHFADRYKLCLQPKHKIANARESSGVVCCRPHIKSMAEGGVVAQVEEEAGMSKGGDPDDLLPLESFVNRQLATIHLEDFAMEGVEPQGQLTDAARQQLREGLATHVSGARLTVKPSSALTISVMPEFNENCTFWRVDGPLRKVTSPDVKIFA